jgi:hypothetical protein
VTARTVLDGIKREASAMENLLDTRAGMALANAAWHEGASSAIRYCNDDDAVTKPVSPYSAPLLAMIKSGVTDPAPGNVERLTAALEAVLEVHEPVEAVMNPGRHERIVKVCTGCGADDGNWQRWPCPTVSAVEAALKEGQ